MEEKEHFDGAVTLGNAWFFGKLETKSRVIYQDINLYSVPNNLESLLNILVNILDK